MSFQDILKDPVTIGLLLWLAFGKYFTILVITLLTKVKGIQTKRIYNIEIKPKQLKGEIESLWMVVTDVVVLVLLMITGAIRLAPETGANIAITIVVFFIWADFWMYWTHRWMHEKEFLRSIHAHHHASLVPHPISSISFSFVEKFIFYTCGWLFFLALVSWFMPITLIGIVSFYSFYFITSPIAHMNIEMFSPPKNKILKKILILGSASSHAMHHARIKGNYGFLTNLYDKIFNTYFHDTEIIQFNAHEGKGLTKLNQKLTEESIH